MFVPLLVVDYLPDEARADNTDDENTAAEDVDYDEIFDDNLLKQAFEYNKRRAVKLTRMSLRTKM